MMTQNKFAEIEASIRRHQQAVTKYQEDLAQVNERALITLTLVEKTAADVQQWHVRRSGKDGQSPSDRRTRDTDRRTPRHNTTQDTNCSQSERTRIDKDTTLVNLASPPTRLEPQTQWRGQTTLAHR
ncbi:hypothetical protein MHU86_15090 [Fragilaria crotonensis]|nr:hypothetical protein MHU86_15090 [Fragilaria crotonensis]